MLISTLLVVAADMRPIHEIEFADYVNSYYVAGKMVTTGSTSQLYPPPGTTDLRGTPFDSYAHKLLPHVSPDCFFLFMYPPLTAIFFAPLSLLDPRVSLVVWQLLNVGALAATALIFSRYTRNMLSPFLLFFSAFLVFPVMQNLVMGQTDLLFGLLPLTAGYVLWQKNRPYAAGLVWSLLWLKPQCLVPIGAIMIVLAICAVASKDPAERKSLLRPILSFAAGSTAFHALALLLLGPESFVGWLRMMQLVSNSFAHLSYSHWQNHLVISVPSGLLLSLPAYIWDNYRIAAQTASGLAFVFLIKVLWRVSQFKLPPDTARAILLVAAMFFLPMASIYLRLNDVVLFLLPAWIIFSNGAAKALARVPMLLLFLASDIYVVAQLVPGQIPDRGLLLVSVTLAVSSLMVAIRALHLGETEGSSSPPSA
jgi:hypothetical protein